MLYLEGKKEYKILMILTIFLWSHKYFVISNFDQNCVPHAISLNKYYSFNIASLCHKNELIEILESILADSINVGFLVCFGG